MTCNMDKMSNPELKANVGSSLSADAESFVPSHMKSTSETGSFGKVQDQPLPHYMTSCYPFVTPGENSTRPRNANWQQRGALLSSQSRQPRPFPAPGMFTFTGSRPPGPQNFTSPRMTHHPSPRAIHPVHPTSHGNLSSPLSPQAVPRLQGQNSQIPQSQMPGLLPTPSINQQALLPTPAPQFRLPVNAGVTTPPGPPPVWLQQGIYNQGIIQATQQMGVNTNIGYGGNHSDGKLFEKAKGRKKKEWNQMISIGVQNESGTYLGNLAGLKKKMRPRTIICMDANVQTDFSDELANKTLAEKPSSIYQKEWTRNWLQLYQDSTTESEEVDSDSGYSSPMHRRNQASSGTHPLTAAEGVPVTYGQSLIQQQQKYQISATNVQQESFSGYAQAVISGYNKKNRHPGESKPNHYHQVKQSQSNHNNATDVSLNPAATSDTSVLHSHHKQSQNQVHHPFHQQHQMKQKQSSKNNVVVQKNTELNVQSGLNSYSVSTCKESELVTNKNYTSNPSGALYSANNTNNIKSNVENNTINQNDQCSLAKTEISEDGANMSDSKRKKKRNRRRKKKSKSGASSPERPSVGGAMSDGPYDLHRAHSSSNVSRTSTLDNDILHFEDENEFPNLLSAVGGLSDSHPSNHPSSLSYSDILKGHPGHALSQESVHSFSSGGFKSSPESSSVKSSKEGKNARKRRKRQEAVDHAADVELAEITLEQQVLKELSAKSQKTLQIKEEQKQHEKQQKQQSHGGGGKKSKQPISLSIADMITKLEIEKQDQEKNAKSEKKSTVSQTSVANVLDANAPKKRGKERETPKVKKPSPLKKVILKEREEKKRLRLLEDGVTVEEVNTDNDEEGDQKTEDEDEEEDENEQEEAEVAEEQEIGGVELSQDAVSSNRSSLDIGGTGTGTGSADLSPISQTSPISMSPLSGSPCNSGFNSPIASNSVIGTAVSSSVLTRIHSRRFREYCTQILDKDIDTCCSNLLQELVRFQDRVYHKDPSKAKSKRRIVLGLREVKKHLNLKKIKCVIISPNLERIQSKGGLDEALNHIINECQLQDVPFVFALGRRALGRACAKLVPVSVVGVFNYDGCEVQFKQMMELTEKARQEYTDMIDALEKEMLDQEKDVNLIQPLMHNNSGSGSSDVIPKLFPHMGHSRTPSACSAISFCSSILSEPISENYPHSEPETDSRGYEIPKDNASASTSENNGSKDVLPEKLQQVENEEGKNSDSAKISSINSSPNKLCAAEMYDIDEGHEADTEDDPSSSMNKSRTEENSNVKGCSNYYSSKFKTYDDKDELSMSSSSGEVSFIQKSKTEKSVISVNDASNNMCSDEESDTTDTNSQCQDRDTLQELPHIESIHTAGVDLNSEILSQHSSKTLDLNSEVLSTHSSKTVEAAGSQTPDRSSRNMGSASDLREASTASGSGAKKVKTVDKERIESWVLETQKQIEMLSVDNGDVSNSNFHCEHECNGEIVKDRSDLSDTNTEFCGNVLMDNSKEEKMKNCTNGSKELKINNNGVDNNEQMVCEDGFCSIAEKT